MNQLFTNSGARWGDLPSPDKVYFMQAVGGQQRFDYDSWVDITDLDCTIDNETIVRLKQIEFKTEMLEEYPWGYKAIHCDGGQPYFEFHDAFSFMKAGNSPLLMGNFKPFTFTPHETKVMSINRVPFKIEPPEPEAKMSPDFYSSYELMSKVLVDENRRCFMVTELIDDIIVQGNCYTVKELHDLGFRIAKNKKNPNFEKSRSLDKNE